MLEPAAYLYTTRAITATNTAKQPTEARAPLAILMGEPGPETQRKDRISNSFHLEDLQLVVQLNERRRELSGDTWLPLTFRDLFH